ncbi:MAG TPA: hypothetical protein VGJ58_13260 [Gaiellaceae bacterium]
MIANVAARDNARVREYGAVETVDHHTDNVHNAVAAPSSDGIEVLVDLANDADEFANLASLVRGGGTALTTRYVADVDSLAARGVTGVNFAYQASGPLLTRLADAVATDGVVPPPLETVALDDAPHVLRGSGRARGRRRRSSLFSSSRRGDRGEQPAPASIPAGFNLRVGLRWRAQ